MTKHVIQHIIVNFLPVRPKSVYILKVLHKRCLFENALFQNLKESIVIVLLLLVTAIIVRQNCDIQDPNGGFGGKSTKFHTDDVEEILKEFRYYAKLNFSREAHKFQKSKMADAESKFL